MKKGLLFLCCACCILILTIVNLTVGPIISGAIGYDWGTLNCAELKDNYDEEKERNKDMTEEEKKYNYEWYINRCQRRKAMHNIEYTAFIFDIVIGFTCGLLGLLHFFEINGEYVEKTGLIGLFCGIVGFILSFVYVVFNGIVFTTDYNDANLYKTDSKGAYAKLVEPGKYECMYFDKKGNDHALKAKFSDYIKKQYNYNKDLIDKYSIGNKGVQEKKDCILPLNCDDNGYMTVVRYYEGNKECKYIYSGYTTQEIEHKDIGGRFLTALILCLIVCLANIGLALFGFFMAKSGEF